VQKAMKTAKRRCTCYRS